MYSKLFVFARILEHPSFLVARFFVVRLNLSMQCPCFKGTFIFSIKQCDPLKKVPLKLFFVFVCFFDENPCRDVFSRGGRSLYPPDFDGVRSAIRYRLKGIPVVFTFESFF